jgi:hypothetical protein
MSIQNESPEVQAAMILAAAVLLASGKYQTTEDAWNEVRCVRAVLRCEPLAVAEDRPF